VASFLPLVRERLPVPVLAIRRSRLKTAENESFLSDGIVTANYRNHTTATTPKPEKTKWPTRRKSS
jgi:hypothetical protein